MTGHQIPRGALLDELRALADDLGRPPKIADVHDQAAYDYDTYRRRFGGLTPALEAAGIEPDPSAEDRGPGAIDRQALLDELSHLGDELDHSPRIADVQRDGQYSQATFYNHFESFTAALEEAGFTPAAGNKISRAELLEALHELAEELGGTPTGEQMKEHGRYSPAPYQREFGGWVEALDAAGLNE